MGSRPKAPKPSEEEKRYYRSAAGMFDTQAGIAREQWDTYKTTGLPALKRLQAEVDNYDSPGRIAMEEGRAATDVGQAYDRERTSLMNSMARFGMRPGSGRFTSALRSLALGRAADTAGAKTGARIGVLDRALAHRFNMTGIMHGVAGAAQAGLGSAGRGLGNLAGGMRSERMAVMQAGAQHSGGMMAGLGNLVGSGIGAWAALSDRRLKRNIRRIERLPNGLGVYEFTYLDNDEAVFTGVMAHEVIHVMPEHVGEFNGFLTVDYLGLLKDLSNDNAQRIAA